MLSLKTLIRVMLLLISSSLQAQNSEFNASHVLLVPPVGFKYNNQTAKSNRYQKNLANPHLLFLVMREFEQMVASLKQNGIGVFIYDQPLELPDAVFPNNWFSTHINQQGQTDVIIYPMLTPNRQAEVNPQKLISFLKNSGINAHLLIDLRNEKGGILEGTGSMILDRKNKVIYASLSDRTVESMVNKAAAQIGDYQTVIFNSYDALENPIYHTNVMMSLGHKFSVICLECINNPSERKKITLSLKNNHKIIINITRDQVKHMCGNVLELINNKQQYVLVLSQQAFDNFTVKQKKIMAQYDKLLPINIKTIETVGGGSVRCMLGEIFI